jgi:transposase
LRPDDDALAPAPFTGLSTDSPSESRTRARRFGIVQPVGPHILQHRLLVPRAARKLTWADRAWLALLAGLVPVSCLPRIRLIVAPGTLLGWHRDLLRRRWAAKSRPRRPGRPRTHRNIRALVLRLARQNPSWGYRRIHGELAGLGIRVAPSTVWEILKSAGVDPAPERDAGPTWASFLRSQAEAILACDFVVVDLIGGSKAYVLALIEHATRRVRVLGATLHPTSDWVLQQARNLLMDLEYVDSPVRFLIHDRDASFGAAFDAVFSAAAIDVIRTGIRAPRQNSIMERWFRSMRAELTDRTLIWNVRHLFVCCASTRSTTTAIVRSAVSARLHPPGRCPTM